MRQPRFSIRTESGHQYHFRWYKDHLGLHYEITYGTGGILTEKLVDDAEALSWHGWSNAWLEQILNSHDVHGLPAVVQSGGVEGRARGSK